MGKKKSVVLLTFITILILAICVVSGMPSFWFSAFDKDSIKGWWPAAAQMDLDANLDGGYYTHYYPMGVISELEYEARKAELDTQEKLDEYEKSYHKHKGLYLSTDEDDGLLRFNSETNEYEVLDGFKQSFKKTVELISARYEASMYSVYRVSVVDDYAIKVEIPASDANASTTLTYFAYTGAFNITDGTNELFPADEEVKIRDYFKSFSAKEKNGTAYVEIKTTDAGSKKLEEFTTASSDNSSAKSVSFNVGENVVFAPETAYVVEQSNNVWVVGMNDLAIAHTVCVILETAIEFGDTEIAFFDDVEKFELDIGNNKSVYGENARNLLFVAIVIVLALAIVLPIIKYRGYGVALAYSTAFYFGAAAFCFAFISEGVMEFSAASALVFVVGLVLILLQGVKTYGEIKKDFEAGKTVESAIKTGHKKTVLIGVDVSVILFAIGLICLIGGASLKAIAIQTMVCAALVAFCGLILTRMCNALLVSASKNKIKHLRFSRVEEDDEDDE